MALKTERMEARVSPDERERIEQAASVAGVSVSAFVVAAAVERAEEVIAATMNTVVPADYFDDLLGALDEAGSAPQLTAAARQAGRSRRIQAL